MWCEAIVVLIFAISVLRENTYFRNADILSAGYPEMLLRSLLSCSLQLANRKVASSVEHQLMPRIFNINSCLVFYSTVTARHPPPTLPPRTRPTSTTNRRFNLDLELCFPRRRAMNSQDLAKADQERNARPWIVVAGHRPMYSKEGMTLSGLPNGNSERHDTYRKS